MKQRYDFLDGFRGLAAFVVLMYHTGLGWLGSPFGFPYGYLAVDFFFCLSGLVVATAYEDRIRSGLLCTEFMKIRITRLYPVAFFGVLLGTLFGIGRYHANEMAFFVLTGLLIIPGYLDGMSGRTPAIPINTPAWSLFSELVVNGIYARFIAHLRGRHVVICALISLGALLAAGLHFGTISLGPLMRDALVGPFRALFSFTIGVLIHRAKQAGLFTSISLPPQVAIAILCGLWAMPCPSNNLVYEIIVVAVATPLVILMASNVMLGERSAKLCRFFGALSYPIYILQGPLFAYMGAVGHLGHQYAGEPMGLLALMLTFVPFLLFCWWVLLRIDRPGQLWLRKMLDRREPHAAAATNSLG